MRTRSILLITAVLIASLGSAFFGATPVHAACDKTKPYTVLEGETLYSIAQKCSVSYVVLMNINYEISDPNLIRPGQTIRLAAELPLSQYTQPVSGPAQPYGLQADGMYIVRPGDSLARIAYLYATTLWELYQANPQLGGRPVVYTGQVIQLPSDARKQKGWVGVSSLVPAPYSSIIARVVDFPPYAPITFRLHEIYLDETNAGVKEAGPGDIQSDDPYSYYFTATTDARGSARVTIKFTYAVGNGETWIVDAFTTGLGEADTTLARSPVMYIGGQD